MSRLARVLVADPPWSFGDKLPGKSRGAEKNYSVLSLSDIQRFPLPDLADDAILFLWRVSSQVAEAYRVIDAWGFVPKTELVWIKTTGTVPPEGEDEKLHFGMGHYTRAAHETCILATRGSFKVADRGVRSVFTAPVGKHSEKPAAFFEIVEKLAGVPSADATGADDGLVELFARVPRVGWHCFGNELPTGYVWTPRGTPASTPPEHASPVVLYDPTQSLESARAESVARTAPVVRPSSAEGAEPSAVPVKDSKAWAKAIKRAAAPEPPGEDDGSPPEPEDVKPPRIPTASAESIKADATRRTGMGPLPDHVIPELGVHPAILPEEKRGALVARAVTDGLLSADDAKDAADAWVKLQYRAPAGWFAGASMAKKERPEGLAALAQGLRDAGMPVHLVTLAGWTAFRHTLLGAWLDQGAGPDACPDFLVEEVQRNPKAELPAGHAEKAAARGPRGTDASTVIENMSGTLAADVESVEGPKAKRGRKPKTASAASILSGGWAAAIEAAKKDEPEEMAP
jgi:N6-adenosine-specific RNA methylase IME4